jgi:chromate transporter
MSPVRAESVGRWELVRYFLWLGSAGFGGPIALVGYMQRDLVERRGWFSEREFGEGLAFSQLAPGPLAAQLGIWLGWRRAGLSGATLAGAAFILPSLAMVLVLSVLYDRFDGLPWLRSAFYGIGAAAIAIIARSAVKLVRVSMGRDVLLWAVGIANMVVVAATETELLTVLLASGILVLAARTVRGARGGSVAGMLAGMMPQLPGQAPSHLELFAFFGQAGAMVFGSGLAIVPFLYGGVVQEYGWLNDRQFLDSVAVSMITPGPVVITVAFIGYLTTGVTGALVASLGVFLPVYLIVILAAPFYQRLLPDARVRAFVAGITAATTGAVAGAVIVLGRRALVDPFTVLLSLLVLFLVCLPRRAPDAVLMLGAGVLGIVVLR